ncbi:hypothetical protein D9M71_318330 [compost metagenome]
MFGLHRDRHQLQADRPAIGKVVDQMRGVQVNAVIQVIFEKTEGFTKGEGQLAAIDFAQFAHRPQAPQQKWRRNP